MNAGTSWPPAARQMLTLQGRQLPEHGLNTLTFYHEISLPSCLPLHFNLNYWWRNEHSSAGAPALLLLLYCSGTVSTDPTSTGQISGAKAGCFHTMVRAAAICCPLLTRTVGMRSTGKCYKTAVSARISSNCIRNTVSDCNSASTDALMLMSGTQGP